MFSNHPDITIPNTSLEKWELEDGFRYYRTPEDNIYPSVTSFLGHDEDKKAGLQEWRDRVGEEEARKITEHSAFRGTQYHNAIERYLQNENELKATKGMIPDAQFLFKKVKCQLHRIDNIVAQEVSMYSDIMQLAGTVDCIAEFDGVLSSIDFKTSRKPKKLEWIQDYIYQTLIYSIMAKEMYGLHVPRLVVIIADEQTNKGYSFVIDNPKEYLRSMMNQLKKFQREVAINE